jgi:hypothetical protein
MSTSNTSLNTMNHKEQGIYSVLVYVDDMAPNGGEAAAV